MHAVRTSQPARRADPTAFDYGTPPSRHVLPAASLAKREIVRFLRQRSRVVGGLATPILFWVLLGSGVGRSFVAAGADSGVDYMHYYFSGSVILVVLFTAIFATISIIEDRHAGFLQSVIVSPASRLSIAAGKIGGAAALGFAHAMLFVLAAPLAGIALTAGKLAAAAGVLAIASVGMAGMGVLVAWAMDSSQGFHSIMNVVMIPMWMLSGALFPASGSAGWLKALMAVNPLTYAVAALRGVLDAGAAASDPGIPSLGVSIGVSILFAVVMTALATRSVATRS